MNSFLIAPFLVTFAGPVVALAVILMARLTGPGLAPVADPPPAPHRDRGPRVARGRDGAAGSASGVGPVVGAPVRHRPSPSPGISQSVVRLSRTELSHG